MLLHWATFILQKIKSLILTYRLGSLGQDTEAVSFLIFCFHVKCVFLMTGEQCSFMGNKITCWKPQ